MTISFLPRLIEEYAESMSSPETPSLAALNRETNLKRGDAVMLSGHLQGAFLEMISKMICPFKILEIGTFTGYSAICLARGLKEGGMLHTIEIDEELRDIAASYFRQSGLEHNIVQHTGDAIEVIRNLDETFDLVFIDADKINYEHYYRLVFDKVRPGGFIVADNVLYDGEVILPEEQRSKNARAILAFNNLVKDDDRVTRVLVPLRDGLLIIRKI